MEADARGAHELPIGSRMDRELVDLALSVNAAVVWSFTFADGAVTWMPGMDQLFGMPDSAEHEVRTRLLELIEPVTSAARSAPVWQDLELEQEFTDPGGKHRVVRFRGRRFEDDTGGGLVGVAADASTGQRNQQMLADLADRYRLLVELSPDAICVHQDGVLTYVNPATVQMLKAESDDQLIDRPVTDFIAPGDVPELLRRIQALGEPGATSAPSTAGLLRFDGGWVPVEAVSVRTTWEGRRAYQVIMRDITVQREAESALRYQAALVEHVSDAIIATTREGIVTSWNPAAEGVYGVFEEQAVGRGVGEVVGAALDPAALVAGGGRAQVMHRRSDGSRLTIRLSASEMDSGYVIVCADETARRRAEEHHATVVDSLDEGVMVLGPRRTIESTNPAALSILGTTEAEFLGATPEDWGLFDEMGTLLPVEEYPGVHTQRTGIPQNSRLTRLQRPDGRWVWLAITSRSLMPESTPPHSVVISFTDITESRAIRERLEQEATHDPLTGLANRTLLLRRIREALRSAHRAQWTAVLFVDLDQFKIINDSLGHGIGDVVLRIVGERLRATAPEEDLVGRLGGDEFLLLRRGGVDDGELGALAENLREELTRPMTVEGRQLHVDASVGIVLAPTEDARTAEDLLRDADVAMYQAKALGRGRYTFFDVTLRERLQRHMHLEQDLRDALPERQLWMAYQPVVDLRSERLAAVEGLLRWTHPVQGQISPAEFIPLAEESELINKVGAHMLGMATRELATYRADHEISLGLKVNLSARQLDDPNLLPSVKEALAVTGIPASTLCLEVTESELMRDLETATRVLSGLRELGVSLAIDDFGTGYSSLAQLHRLPLDTLKIDRSFVVGLGESHDAEVFITSIIAMAHAVDLMVVAEGAETTRQVDLLQRLGCDQVQGFGVGKPVPLDELSGTIRAASGRFPPVPWADRVAVWDVRRQP